MRKNTETTEKQAKKKTTRTIIIVAAVVAALALIIFLMKHGEEKNYKYKYEGYDLTADVKGTEREDSYTKYLAKHDVNAEPRLSGNGIEIDLGNYVSGEGVKFVESFEGRNNVLYTDNESMVTWKVNVPESGFYNLQMDYFATQSRGVAVERGIYINGALPFADAGNMLFTRIWKDGGEKRVDNQGNEIRPTQVEVFDWQTGYFRDDMGYITEPYKFWLEAGEQTIGLEAVNEPVAISSLRIVSVEDEHSYDMYCAENAGKKDNASGKDIINKIQGEESTLRSEASLYAKYDRASSTTQPYSVMNTILNYIGGDPWSTSSQWIEWETEIPEDGFYNITVKGRQNYARGQVSVRSLYIDGVIPFDEAKIIEFDYDNDWQVKTLSDENGEAYKFYLTKGKHTIRLEATLGKAGAILEELEDSVFRLNQIYRRVLIYTGATPDKYRDYNIDQYYPEIIEAMDIESRRLFKIIDDTVEYTGQKADKIGTAVTVASQLERFVEKPFKISSEFVSFRDNITSMGTAILSMSETKLDVDYIVVSSAGDEIEKDKTNIFKKLAHGVRSFIASFIVDYDAVGDVYDEKTDKILKIWVTTGRDQGTIIKTMIDDAFTPQTGIKVNVEIVNADALLGAVVAGQGPDVVLSIANGFPVNYALRNGAVDLTEFDDLDEVLEEFYPSAYEPYKFNGGIYGLPETQTYNLLFYRKDVLEELGLEVPNTWDDVIGMLPTIQGNNMEFCIPAASSSTADVSLYYTLLYQMGGGLYDKDGMTTTVNNEQGVNAFEMYTRLFNDYGSPTEYDFISRFRSGLMPIGISNYATYNTLVVSAPEIRGLWDFTLIPAMASEDENGNTVLNRSVHSDGVCCMMIQSDDQEIKNMGWEFMKWWVGSESQVRFGREMEALLGSSARYATANVNAFVQLSWSAHAIDVLSEQRKTTVGMREVAGGYYLSRHVTNAVRKVINAKEDPRETILDYAITIDEELTKKRKEFGLPTAED
ncbi:MAG: extracellular solute-binding protein [Lachnospiraceae bacterium]|nr:extracellular solute-binding protein [Lachnospiraceae bacterium]